LVLDYSSNIATPCPWATAATALSGVIIKVAPVRFPAVELLVGQNNPKSKLASTAQVHSLDYDSLSICGESNFGSFDNLYYLKPSQFAS